MYFMRVAFLVIAFGLSIPDPSFSIPAAEIRSIYKKALSGDVDSQVFIGYICDKAQDYGEALQWYVRAMDAGSLDATNKIGNMFYHGHGVPRKYDVAKTAYTIAATKGHKYAQYNLGNFWYHGLGGERDLDQAIYWRAQSCKNGFKKACNDLDYIFKTRDLPLRQPDQELHENTFREVMKQLKSLRE